MSLSLLKAIPFITFTLDNFLVSNEGVKRDIIHLEMKKYGRKQSNRMIFFAIDIFNIVSFIFR